MLMVLHILLLVLIFKFMSKIHTVNNNAFNITHLFQILIYIFMTLNMKLLHYKNNTSLRIKSKDSLAQSQNNMSEWISIMSACGLLMQMS